MCSSADRPQVPRTEGTTPELAYPEVTDPTNWRFGRLKPGKPVWVRLDRLYIRDPGQPAHVNGSGVAMEGEVPGVLSHWIPTLKGDWMGVASFSVHYGDGREPEHFKDQFVPGYALRPREPTRPADSPP